MPTRENKPKSWFKTAPQPRHSLPAVQEMQASLEEHGQLSDLAALRDGTLIYGHRRLAAAMLSNIITTLWVLIYDEPLSPSEIRTIQLVENIQREDLTPYELACGVRSLVEEGTELREVAKRLGKGPTWATRYMYPWKCIPDVQEAFKAGAIGITDCEAMAKEGREEQHAMLAARLGHQATRDDLVRRARRAARHEKVRVNRIRFPLPGGVTITLVGHGLAMDLAIESLVEGAKAMRKGKADGLDAKTFQAAMQCKAKGESDA